MCFLRELHLLKEERVTQLAQVNPVPAHVVATHPLHTLTVAVHGPLSCLARYQHIYAVAFAVLRLLLLRQSDSLSFLVRQHIHELVELFKSNIQLTKSGER
jgi:hypothetical protein